MPMFIALLRGINVGKANRVPMAELRALLTEQGHTDVATLLNSGNVVFRAARGAPDQHAAAITAALCERFNIDVHVIVKSVQDLNAIIEENPIDMASADPSQVLVAFVQEAASLQGLRTIEQLVSLPEQLAFGQQAAYLHCANGILESKVAKAFLGKAGKMATSRNWGTVLKLQALAQASQ